MPLRHTAIDKLEEGDLQSLIDSKCLEGKTIEYKEALHNLGSDEGKIEFLADVSSFATTDGGDIVFGIREEKRVPVEVCGARDDKYDSFLTLEDVDRLKNRMEALLATGVAPRITGLKIRPVYLANGKLALIVRVPRSFAMPHMVVYNQEYRFWNRTNAGKKRMDVNELRASYNLAAQIMEQAKRFRVERIGAIGAGHGPYALVPGSFYAMHLIPFGFTDPAARINIGASRGLIPGLSPLEGSVNDWRHNIDGFVCVTTRDQGGRAFGYTQLFRSGALEVAGVIHTLAEQSIYLFPLEQEMFKRLPEWLDSLVRLGVEGPFILMFSLVGVKGNTILRSTRFVRPGDSQRYVFDRDVIQVPDVVLDTPERTIGLVLKDIFDIVWQACGFERDQWIDETGKLQDP